MSYFESIARPQFSELLNNSQPTETFDLFGNPYLNHSTAHNFDARYELFPKGLDQVLIGAFYKIIENPIEYTIFSTGTSAQGIKPVNDTNNAINYGAELVLTKYFHYFGVSANYTYTHSAITVPELYYGALNTSPVATTETRPQQARLPISEILLYSIKIRNGVLMPIFRCNIPAGLYRLHHPCKAWITGKRLPHFWTLPAIKGSRNICLYT